MTFRVLKLSNLVINVGSIKYIDIKPGAFYVYMGLQEISGSFLFGSGGLEPNEKCLDIKKETNPKDFEIVQKWLDSL